MKIECEVHTKNIRFVCEEDALINQANARTRHPGRFRRVVIESRRHVNLGKTLTSWGLHQCQHTHFTCIHLNVVCRPIQIFPCMRCRVVGVKNKASFARPDRHHSGLESSNGIPDAHTTTRLVILEGRRRSHV